MAIACGTFEYVEYVRQKVESLRAQIHQISCVDFPYEDPSGALAVLAEAFETYVSVLDDAVTGGNEEEIIASCKTVNFKIVEFHPVLGFLLRSTNIRNSFEAYDPLRSLAHAILPYRPGVILSSEWEFSPFTYPAISDDLPDFVFIGLPASEAGNALVLPLAGHELAHSVWRRCGVGNTLTPIVNQCVFESYLGNPDGFQSTFSRECTADTLLNDPEVLRNFSLACVIAGRQCEEVFCDLFGVRLFGEAFLHSFEYLLIPSLGGERSELYPPLRTRLTYMIKGAQAFGLPLEEQHHPPVLESEKNLPARQRLAVQMADTASASLFSTVLQAAAEYCKRQNVAVVDPSAVKAVAASYAAYIPAENAGSLANVVGAGWTIYRRFDEFAAGFKSRKEAFDVLNSLVFKSLEVLEYEAKVIV